MPAEPEREGEGRRADEAIVAVWLQHVFRIAVGARQHVALEMHRALRLAGGAGRERDQADIVTRGVAGGEIPIARPRHQIFELTLTPIDDALELTRERPRFLHFVE